VTARRVLIVAYCFPPHAAIGTHRTLRLVTHLADRGWDVGVLTARADGYLPGTPLEEGLMRRVPATVRVERSGVLRGFTKLGRLIQPLKRQVNRRAPATPASIAAPNAKTTPGVKAIVEELCAMPDKEVGWLVPALVHGLLTFSKNRPHVVFSSGPPWTSHVVAGLLASIFRCRWVADFRDPWVRSPWTRYHTRPARAVARRLEAWVVRSADGVVFTTEAARDEFAAHYGPAISQRLHVVFNGCDPADLVPVEDLPDHGRFVLLHAGSLYGGRSPMPLLQAVATLRLQHPHAAERLRVRFLGSTSFPGVDLPRSCADLGLSDVVEFVPRVERDESLREMSRASALLILQTGTTMAIPGKLYEYLAAGRPVLALCEPGEMDRLIRTNRVGLTANPADRPEIERTLLALLAAPPGGWKRANAELFDGRLRAAEIGAVIETVVAGYARRNPASPAIVGGPGA
jgi:glycosyltransferase involved in cell wall biosynthesis